MSKKKRKKRKAPKEAQEPAEEVKAAEAAEAKAEAKAEAAKTWQQKLRPYLLLIVSAVLHFLGFAGFGIWPLGFMGMVLALFVFEQEKPTGWRAFRMSLLFGYVATFGGFYWVIHTLVVFGGFPFVVCILFASILYLYQALQFVLILWLWRRARDRGWNATLALVAAYLTSELVFVMLFDNFYGNAFHMLPPLIQIADLGGPMLVTALSMVVNGALFELAWAFWQRKKAKESEGRPPAWPKAAPIAAACALAFTLIYGFVRIGQVDERAASADHITVGVVQTNMGIFEKRENPREGLRRHVEQTLELEAEAEPQLIVWPESAATFFIPERITNVRHSVLGGAHTPVLFGGLSRRNVEGVERFYNTAFITDGEGEIQGTYDKTYLLAFGEYLPFGEQFPVLYDLSPNSGHFTPGNHVHSLPLRVEGRPEYRIAALVCYEDILTGFVRRAVSEEDPHLLVNVTNDAWFGDTQEPWVHLALAKFRAVEHRRYLIRATNTGVSAIVDATGRLVEHSGTFERASLSGEVAMLSGWTLYQSVGDWPGWLSLIGILLMAFVLKRPAETTEPSLEEAKDDVEDGEQEP